MKVEKINNYTNLNKNYTLQQKKVGQNFANNNYGINSLEHLAALNKPNFTGKKYELGLSHDELVKRTNNECLGEIQLLSQDSPQYQNLAKGDKKALKHLIKAADMIGLVEKQLDDANNLPFEKHLEKEIKKGNEDAHMTKKLYDGMMGISGKDNLQNNVSLIKNYKKPFGDGFYPADLTKEEFHTILISMLEKGKNKEVAKILTQHSVVVRDGKELKGIEYVDRFYKEFKIAADELEKAAKCSTNKDFNEYLKLQAKALRKADPMLDAKADMKWATLQDTPLEFTITRENYEDKMTMSIIENDKLSKMLEESNITPVPKDNLGARVGIVDKEGSEFLLKSKELLPLLADRMPYNDEYTQTINGNNKQTMVDVDLVSMTGDVGEYRAGITMAENLPNSDKLSLSIGGGRRNVYHKQVRDFKSFAIKDTIIPSQRKYLASKYNHMWTIGHENGHSLGPKNVDKLGKYRNIIEENKADMISIAFIDYLTDKGFYTDEDRKGILANFVLTSFLQAQPDKSMAHRVRSVMQQKFFEDNGVYSFTPDGKVYVNIDKVVPTAKKMLDKIIKVQIDNDYNKAEEYVNEYFVWTPKMEYVAQQIQKSSKLLNGTLNTPLADSLRAD